MRNPTLYDYIKRLSELLKIDSRKAGAQDGLQPVQLEVLHYLSICNRFSDTPMAVTEYLGQTKGTVSQTLKVLERKGMLSKLPDKDDKRVFHLKVSDKGQRLLAHCVPTPMITSACETLSVTEHKQISDALKQLLETIVQANKLKSFGICRTCHYNTKNQAGDYFCSLVKQPLSHDEIQLICKEHESITGNENKQLG
jgi:DNA-binding MarR family transcriptional regulator